MRETNITKKQIVSWIKKQWKAQQALLESLDDEDNYIWITNCHRATCECGVHVQYEDLKLMADMLGVDITVDGRDADEYDKRAYFEYLGIRVYAVTDDKEIALANKE